MAALPAEARHLGPAAPDRLIEVSGMGCDGAARAARALVRRDVTALATFGLAGGLDPALTCGRIFLPSEVVSGSGQSLPTATSWREGLALRLAACSPVSGGRLLTSVRAIGSVAEKAAAFQATGAAAVDMESFAVAEVAAERKLPFMALRVIVDAADDAVPSAVLASAERGGAVRMWPLLRSLLRSPGDVSGLLRLGARYRVASRSLALAASEGLLKQAAVGIP